MLQIKTETNMTKSKTGYPHNVRCRNDFNFDHDVHYNDLSKQQSNTDNRNII